MAELAPFPAVRYRVPDAELARVLAPPYDVIPAQLQQALYARDPRNVVRVVRNRTPGEAGYAEAGATHARWLAAGVLAPDARPAFYLLEQSFAHAGRALARLGLLARFRAEDHARGTILPHEQTRPAAREDRWRVLTATRANFSPIFMTFSDAHGRFQREAEAAASAPPLAQYVDDAAVAHRLWAVTDAGAISRLRELLAGARCYIADGHHRYATALRYRDAHGPEGAWTLGYFTPMEAPGLVILPYHRVLAQGPSLAEARARLAGAFLLSAAEAPAAAARAVAHSTMPYAFALAAPGGGALVAEALPEAEDLLPPEAPDCLKALDAYFLHQAVLPKLLSVPDSAVGYVHSLPEAEAALTAGACRLALLMRATPVRQVVDVADAHESMPPKSTFFHPKLPSGLVIHPLAV